MSKFKEFIFKFGYTISVFLDTVIFNKLHVQINHSYTRKKYVPNDEYWEMELKRNPETIKNSTFLYVLFDKDKVVIQNTFQGFVDQESIDQVTMRWYAKVEDYVDRHLYFSMKEWWLSCFKDYLSPFQDKPLQIQGFDGKWYKCIESGNL